MALTIDLVIFILLQRYPLLPSKSFVMFHLKEKYFNKQSTAYAHLPSKLSVSECLDSKEYLQYFRSQLFLYTFISKI